MDWESIIKCGIESDELDYKAAQNWNHLSRAGRAKFARHCMAFANTKGGYIVVGVGEDKSGRPALFTGLSEEEALSFDPTGVGNFINQFADPQIEFTLERPIVDGKQYIIFNVKRFSQLPHVCTGGCEHELMAGAFYIRTADASSRPAYRASEVHALILRAMRNQREQLGRMIRGLLYESQSDFPKAESQSRFTEELTHSRNFFRKMIGPGQKVKHPFELYVYPDCYTMDRFTLTSLREAAEEVFFPHENTDFINSADLNDAYFTNVSLRFSSTERGWQLYRSGLFHFAWNISADPLVLEPLVNLLSDAVQFCSSLYTSLGFNEESLHIEVIMSNVQDQELYLSSVTPTGAVCRIPEIRVQKNYTAADFNAGAAEYAGDLIQSLCERFNIAATHHEEANRQIRSRMGLPANELKKD